MTPEGWTGGASGTVGALEGQGKPIATQRAAGSKPQQSRQLVTNTIVPVFLRHVRQCGKDPGPLIQRFSFPDDVEQRAELRLPLPALKEFAGATEALLNDPFVGMHAAETLQPGTYGLIEFITRTASTVRDSMRQFVRYQSLVDDVVRFSLKEEGGEGVFEFGADGIDESMGRHVNEYTLCVLIGLSRLGCGQAWVPSRAWFAHARPPSISALIELLGTERLEFSKANSGARFPASVLDLPLLSADPSLHAFLEKQASSIVPEAAPKFVGRVRKLVHDAMERGLLSVEVVAQAARCSPRTLQRHLRQDGLSFQAVVDDVRCTAARQLLSDPRKTLGEVAFMLGYSELRPFVRAFRRWTGQTPGQFRAG